MSKGNQPLSRQERNKKTLSKRKQQRLARKEKLKEKRAKQHPVQRFIYSTGRFIRRTMMVSLLSISIIGLIAVITYKNKYEEVVSASIRKGYEIAQTISPQDFKVIEPTVMYYDDGTVAKEFTERNFIYLDLQEDDELFQKVSDVTTSIEDERFYNHKGFDYLGVGVAVLDYARGHSLRGASTLTAQLVKNTYLSQEQSMERKIAEAVVAQELEKRFTKREILEFYVNDAYFANGNYGLATAANYYYSKPVGELTHSEIASLIAIPNNPTIYNPVTNPENNKKRRDLILTLMANNGILENDYVTEEKSKDIVLDITETRIDNNVRGWAESFAMHSAVEELMRHNGFKFEYWFDTHDVKDNYTQRYNDVYSQTLQRVVIGGYSIETSINKSMQDSLQKHVDNALRGYTAIDKDGYYSKQVPSVVIDNRTNEVVAIVGGRSQENPGLFNRAYQSARQPGSAMKPFMVYAPAFEKGLSTGTIREDKPIKNGPGNWYNGYRGKMDLRTSLEQSVNTIAYNLYQEVGMKDVREKLVDMEFNHMSPDDIYPTMSIGGWTHGTNPLEVARALNTMVNDGVYQRPHSVSKLSRIGSDNVIYSRQDHVGKRVFQSGVGYVTLDVMKSTVKNSFVRGYSFGYEHEAAKTGTTNKTKEVWIVGGTPYYSMASYIGDNEPTEQTGSAMTPILQKVYKGVMQEIHSGLEVVDFVKPQTVVQKGDNLWVRTSQDVDPLKDRKNEENKRLQEFANKHSTRVESLAYRIKHGLTLKQAESRELLADAKIQQLESYTLNGSEDMSEANKLKDEASEAVDRVVRLEKKSILQDRLNKAYGKVQAEKNSVIAERERQQRLEQERQQELERELERENEREERRQEELRKQEELRIQEEQRREEERKRMELEKELEENENQLEETEIENEEIEQGLIENDNNLD